MTADHNATGGVSEAEADSLRHDLAVARDAAEVQRARFNRLLVAFHDATRRPLGVVPASGDEFYDHVQACRAEFVRPRIGSVAERDERPETRLATAEARAAKAVEVLAKWQKSGHILLMAGEMTRQELRSVKAVAAGIQREVTATLLSDHPAPEPGVEAGEALAFYADPKSYSPTGWQGDMDPAPVMKDRGEKARLALAQAQRTAKDGGGEP